MPILLILFFCFNAFPQEAPMFEARIEPSAIGLEAKVLKNSISLEAVEGLLAPKAWVEVVASNFQKDISIEYAGKRIGFQEAEKNVRIARFQASLLELDKAQIFVQGTAAGRVYLNPVNKARIVDNNCFKYGLSAKGLKGELLSLGCKKKYYGTFGNESAVLQVSWAAAGWRPIGGAEGIHFVNLRGDRPANIKVQNESGETKSLTLEAKAPLERDRLFMALGLGPYDYHSTDGKKTFDDAAQFMYMLYGKFELTEKHSFKLFDAYIEGASTFNNFGMYFSSDVAKIWNERVVFNTLLGFQDLFFDLPGSQKEHKIIYPQGVEMVLNHPFGLRNYKLMAGGFIGLGGGLDYSNVWLRFGKGIFYELNYLKWAEDDNKAEAFGLSVGIPLFSAF